MKLSDLDSVRIFIGGGGYYETLRFGLCENFHFGGILKLSDLDSVRIFILGGYSETLGFGLCDNFHWGSILKLSDLDSVTISIWGGVFWNSQIWTLWQFSFGGGYSETVLRNRGYSGRIWTKISTTPAGSCITDSLSHTTYVETNKNCTMSSLSQVIPFDWQVYNETFALKVECLQKGISFISIALYWNERTSV